MDKVEFLKKLLKTLEAEGLSETEAEERALDGAHAIRVLPLKQKHLDEAMRIVRLSERVRVAQRKWVVGEGEEKAKALKACKALERELDELLGILDAVKGVPVAAGQTSLFGGGAR